MYLIFSCETLLLLELIFVITFAQHVCTKNDPSNVASFEIESVSRRGVGIKVDFFSSVASENFSKHEWFPSRPRHPSGTSSPLGGVFSFPPQHRCCWPSPSPSTHAASTAYQLHHLRLTSSSGSSCEHNGARIHLGQPYPPLLPGFSFSSPPLPPPFFFFVSRWNSVEE